MTHDDVLWAEADTGVTCQWQLRWPGQLSVPGAATWPLLIMLAQLPVPPARARAKGPSQARQDNVPTLTNYFLASFNIFPVLNLSNMFLMENFPTLISWCKGCVWWWGPSDRTPVQELGAGTMWTRPAATLAFYWLAASLVICGSEEQSFYWTTWKLWLKHLSIEIWWIGNKYKRAIHFAIFPG